MVTPEEIKAYETFCLDQFYALGTPYVELDQPIWHYTDGSSLIEIIKSGKLWSTQMSCLNDMAEINYGSRMLGDALRAILPSIAGKPVLEKFANYYLSLLSNERSDSEEQALSPHYVACFSMVPDSLSQWRAYCGGENGFAIGFSAPNIRMQHLLCAVSYDKLKQAVAADAVAQATLSFFREGLESRPSVSPMDWGNSFLPVWDASITYLATVGKHPSFKEEKEVRIVTLGPADSVDLEFRQKTSIVSRHYPLALSKETRNGRAILPIKEVIVGPSRYKGVSQASVRALLQKHGYGTEINVWRSNCPYQAL
jgi:hypothetical protein